jgi:hypothetical protein
MNCVIGLCTKAKGWPSALAELGYEVQVIEQTIGLSSGGRVKPDAMAVSNKFVHAIVFECKSGSFVDHEQISRYSELRPADLLRWITVYSSSQFKFDLCFSVFEFNRNGIETEIQTYPIMVFGKEFIQKIRDFSLAPLNDKFPIKVGGMLVPLSYYPFSDQDEDAVIIPRVLRMLVQVASQRARGGPSSLAEATFSSEDIVSQIHPYWKALSTEHRNSLGERVRRIISRLLASHGDLRTSLEELENKGGYKILSPLKELREKAELIIAETKTQPTIESFPH